MKSYWCLFMVLIPFILKANQPAFAAQGFFQVSMPDRQTAEPCPWDTTPGADQNWTLITITVISYGNFSGSVSLNFTINEQNLPQIPNNDSINPNPIVLSPNQTVTARLNLTLTGLELFRYYDVNVTGSSQNLTVTKTTIFEVVVTDRCYALREPVKPKQTITPVGMILLSVTVLVMLRIKSRTRARRTLEHS